LFDGEFLEGEYTANEGEIDFRLGPPGVFLCDSHRGFEFFTTEDLPALKLRQAGTEGMRTVGTEEIQKIFSTRYSHPFGYEPEPKSNFIQEYWDVPERYNRRPECRKNNYGEHACEQQHG
jgi:hypothetical protein